MHYKNDCDLAYRLTSAGCKTELINLKVYHARQVSSTSTSLISRMLDHSKKNKWNRESSLFGQLLCIKKNLRNDSSAIVRMKTYIWSIIRFTHTLITSPSLLSSYTKIQVLENDIIKKRNTMDLSLPTAELETLMIK